MFELWLIIFPTKQPDVRFLSHCTEWQHSAAVLTWTWYSRNEGNPQSWKKIKKTTHAVFNLFSMPVSVCDDVSCDDCKNRKLCQISSYCFSRSISPQTLFSMCCTFLLYHEIWTLQHLDVEDIDQWCDASYGQELTLPLSSGSNLLIIPPLQLWSLFNSCVIKNKSWRSQKSSFDCAPLTVACAKYWM